MKRLLLILSLILGTAGATTYAQLSLEEMLERAQLAFYGRGSEVTVEEQEGEPWTVVSFTVLESLLGQLESEHSLSFYGGTLPSGLQVLVTGMPSFIVGDEVLVLAYDGAYYSPIVGFSQGLWRLGPRGFVSERQELLSLDEEGQLLLDGAGGANEEILASLRARLEARQ